MSQLLEAVETGAWGSKAALLKHLRQKRIRRPDLVLKHGTDLLKSPGALGDDAWTIYEQVFLAALDTHSFDVAERCKSRLLGRFPKSIRVRRLVGLELEAKGKYADAEDIYNEILEEDPTFQ